MTPRSYKHRKVQKHGKERDNFMCLICAEVSSTAQGHHMLLHSEDGPEMLDNIITLCKLCHKDYHRGNLKLTFHLRDLGE